VRELIRSAERATTDPVMVEVIGGGRSEIEAKQLTRLLASATYQAQRPQEDILGAADIYRSCRAAGETVRSLDDCLVAAIAIRHHVGVLHCDGEFDVIAHHVPLTAARA
jgi:predicted nucleic acid-binding protein